MRRKFSNHSPSNDFGVGRSSANDKFARSDFARSDFAMSNNGFDNDLDTSSEAYGDDGFDADAFRLDQQDEYDGWDDAPYEIAKSAPSLPIILLSAASGLSLSVICLYLSYRVIGLDVYWSAGIGTLGLSVGLGLAGAFLSALTRSRAALSNIFFSCGLVLATLLFFGLCILCGAFAATLILSFQS